MKTFTVLWQYRLKTYILYSVTSFLKSCRLWGNVEDYGGAREAAMTIGRLRVACWTSKTTRTQVYVHALAHLHTHTRARAYAQKYIILIAFQRQQSFLRTFPILWNIVRWIWRNPFTLLHCLDHGVSYTFNIIFSIVLWEVISNTSTD